MLSPQIAEDRSFSDLAKYIFTTLLAMCLPAPTWVTPEYAPLFLPRGGARPAKLQLLTALRKLLREYKAMLKKFLVQDDDQVRAPVGLGGLGVVGRAWWGGWGVPGGIASGPGLRLVGQP